MTSPGAPTDGDPLLLDHEREIVAALRDEGETAARVRDPEHVVLLAGLVAVQTLRREMSTDEPGAAAARRTRARLLGILERGGLGDSVRSDGDSQALRAGEQLVVVEPLDDEDAYDDRTPTFAATLSLWSANGLDAAVVANPSTGEVLYRNGDSARILQLGLLGAASLSTALPLPQNGPRSRLLRLHASPGSARMLEAAMEAWGRSEVRMVSTLGGSRAWAIADCAQGRFAYAELGDPASGKSSDLAAGTALLRAAGGEVVDLAGAPVEPTTHRGPLIAAIDAETRDAVRALVQSSMG
jgi:fructose-1,6-bisphosphatase/inositol monophosphatase family enzyme